MALRVAGNTNGKEETMQQQDTHGTGRSLRRRSDRLRNISLPIGIVGMFLTISLATWLVTARPAGYVLQEAANEIPQQKLLQRRGKDGKVHSVLKCYNSSTEIDLGIVQGNIAKWSVNSRGEVAYSVNIADQICSYLSVNGKRTAIRVPGARAVHVTKINDAGDVIGMVIRPDRQWSRLVWRAFVFRWGRVIELDTLGGPNCFVNDINGEGLVVGKADIAPGVHHAFLWQAGRPLQDLGTLPRGRNSEAMSINAKREIVGSSDGAAETPYALLWRDGILFDLNRQTPVRNGWHFQESWKINDQGDITVYGFKGDLVRAFLLKAQRNRG